MTHAPHPVKILAVDDNAANLVAMEVALAPLGQTLVTARNGRDALRLVLAEEFATILLDVNMPVMNGFETARMIRGRERTAHTPIIFVSAVSQSPEDALEAYGLGAVDYILTPLVPEILRAKVSVFVELHRQTNEARRQAQRVAERTRELEISNERLRRTERLAAVGTLCAGLGHDMGNLLLPIRLRLEAMAARDLPPEAREDLRAIRSSTEYLQRLTNGLRMFAVDPEREGPAAEPIDVHEWWLDVEPFLRNALPDGVTLERDFEEPTPRLFMPRHRLSQAVFNLVQNAGEVMRQRGHGRVRVALRPLPAEAGKAVLDVSDDGPGMTAEVKTRCLEPFFTTKPRGMSTGLGLALVHGVVKRAGGAIAIDSQPGEGTTFRLILPAVVPPGTAASTSARGGAAPAPRRPVAIVALQDGRMRGYVTSVLQALAFDVRPPTEVEADGAEPIAWITDDAGLEGAPAARAFLEGDARRCVLLFGDPAEEKPGRREHHRIVRLGKSPSAAIIRDRLWELKTGGLLEFEPKVLDGRSTDPSVVRR